jgi:acetyl esterase
MLLYPVTDYYTPGTRSYEENANGYGLTRDTMEWFWDHYLNHPNEAENPYASPLRARDLAGLPSAYVLSAEYDPLRDEGELYGERLQTAGVSARITRRPGMNHGFMFWVGIVADADAAMKDACAWARQVFDGAG